MPPAQPICYGIVDCAQDERLHDVVVAQPHRLCLFKGNQVAQQIRRAAPWLVRLDPGSGLLNLWHLHGRAANWGIMAWSTAPIEQVHRHFRRFLQAKLPDGTIALFRFYDPRVFHTYLRAATPEERAPWFRDIVQYGVEPAGDAPHTYRFHDGRLYDGMDAVG